VTHDEGICCVDYYDRYLLSIDKDIDVVLKVVNQFLILGEW